MVDAQGHLSSETAPLEQHDCQTHNSSSWRRAFLFNTSVVRPLGWLYIGLKLCNFATKKDVDDALFRRATNVSWFWFDAELRGEVTDSRDDPANPGFQAKNELNELRACLSGCVYERNVRSIFPAHPCFVKSLFVCESEGRKQNWKPLETHSPRPGIHIRPFFGMEDKVMVDDEHRRVSLVR